MGKQRLGIWGLAKDHQGGRDPRDVKPRGPLWLSLGTLCITMMGSSPPPFPKAGTEAQRREGLAQSHAIEPAWGLGALGPSTVGLFRHYAPRNDPGMVPLKA